MNFGGVRNFKQKKGGDKGFIIEEASGNPAGRKK